MPVRELDPLDRSHVSTEAGGIEFECSLFWPRVEQDGMLLTASDAGNQEGETMCGAANVFHLGFSIRFAVCIGLLWLFAEGDVSEITALHYSWIGRGTDGVEFIIDDYENLDRVQLYEVCHAVGLARTCGESPKLDVD